MLGWLLAGFLGCWTSETVSYLTLGLPTYAVPVVSVSAMASDVLKRRRRMITASPV
jgi:hypothetical protein